MIRWPELCQTVSRGPRGAAGLTTHEDVATVAGAAAAVVLKRAQRCALFHMFLQGLASMEAIAGSPTSTVKTRERAVDFE